MYPPSHTIFDVKIDVNLLQRESHAWALEIREHHELDIRRRLEIVKLVLICTVGHKTAHKKRSYRQSPVTMKRGLRGRGLTCHPLRLACGPCSVGRRPCQK